MYIETYFYKAEDGVHIIGCQYTSIDTLYAVYLAVVHIDLAVIVSLG